MRRSIAAAFIGLSLAVSAGAQTAPAPMPTGVPGAATPPAAAPAPFQMMAFIGALEGSAEVLLDGIEPWQPAKLSQKLTAGTQVRTKGASSVTLGFTDGSKVRVGPNANFKLEEVQTSKISVYIGLGKMESWVKKWAKRTFQARNPVAVASVRGTVFSMDVRSPTEVTVDLFSGSLAVTDNFGRTTPMAEGQRMNADASGGAAPPAPLPPDVTAPAEPPTPIAELASAASATTPLGEGGEEPPPPGEEVPAEEPAATTEPAPAPTTTTSVSQETSTLSPTTP